MKITQLHGVGDHQIDPTTANMGGEGEILFSGHGTGTTVFRFHGGEATVILQITQMQHRRVDVLVVVSQMMAQSRFFHWVEADADHDELVNKLTAFINQAMDLKEPPPGQEEKKEKATDSALFPYQLSRLAEDGKLQLALSVLGYEMGPKCTNATVEVRIPSNSATGFTNWRTLILKWDDHLLFTLDDLRKLGFK
jgi:hypothetical protein